MMKFNAVIHGEDWRYMHVYSREGSECGERRGRQNLEFGE